MSTTVSSDSEEPSGASGSSPDSPIPIGALRDSVTAFGHALSQGMGRDGLRNYVPIAAVSSALEPMIRALQSVNLYEPIYREVQERSAYSSAFHSVDSYFSGYEESIESFDDLHNAIQKLTLKNPHFDFVWRGQQHAGWGLHSKLFRELMVYNGVRGPEKKHRREECYPTEAQLVENEKYILARARSEWRFENLSALELFARLQHFGAPTRLIDVTKNPYVASWFAVEASEKHDARDARLFALGTLPYLPEEQRQEARSIANLANGESTFLNPFWHIFENDKVRLDNHWGAGTLKRYWQPPLYENRILAQNAGFVLDGVPITSQSLAPYYKQNGSSSEYWRRADLLAAGSIYTKLYKPGRRVRQNEKQNFPPVFTFRICSSAKTEIRDILEKRFAYSRSSLFPDIKGLADELSLPSMVWRGN